MSVRNIPLPTRNQPLRTQRTSLGGVSYRLDFRWASRSNLWFVSIYDSDDNPILLSRALVAKWDILYSCTHPLAPAGRLILVTPDGAAPTLSTIENATLLFFPDA